KDRRSALMSRIRGGDTGIEIEVRRGLHAQGLRYRLGGAGLPGRPDIVLPRFRTVVFVHGCFWHGHECHLFRLPKSNAEFWSGKIAGNRERDRRVADELASRGWRIEVVWECMLRGRSSQERREMISALGERIRAG